MIKLGGLDVGLLCYFLFYIFLFCGLILIAIVYWVGWDNLRFRFKQRQYRSSLVVHDYYKGRRRLKYDHVIGSLDQYGERKLDLTGKEGEERALSSLDSGGVGVAAGNIAFKDGKLEGIFVSYYENGKIESEVSYRDGHLDGPFKAYYGDGRIHVDKFYRDGKLENVFKAWDEDGSVFFEIEYKDGKQHGFDKTYYRSGVLQHMENYKEGRLLNRKTYDESGNLKYEESFE